MSAPIPAGTSRYVGFWQRVLATLIDGLILFVVTVPLVVAIYGRDYASLAREGYAGPWDFAIQVVFPAIATLAFWRYRGATPGKLAIGAKIVDAASGGRPTTARLVVRFFAYLVSALPLGLGLFWVAIDRRKQGWHDKLAGTVVVRDDD